MSFFSQTRTGLAEGLAAQGINRCHAPSLYRGVYKAGACQPEDISGLPAALYKDFPWSLQVPELAAAKMSVYDGSWKFVWRLHDGLEIESVLMPETGRLTLCLSSQVGCRQACSFCHTGRMGLKRQLSAGEIVAQVVAAQRWLKTRPDWLKQQRLPQDQLITNVVFMGMGEPLDNLEELVPAVEILTDPMGLGLAPRRVSVSTAGHLEGLKRFHRQLPHIPVALSVHAAQDKRRSQLMPINRRWPLAEVMDYFRQWQFSREQKGSKVLPLFVQYTLIAGVNDADADAEALIQLLREMAVKVNLIPLNEIEPSALRAPDAGELERFRQKLHAGGLRVMVRYSKGQDIAAACGQLVQ